jgi:hypothetical protein
LSEQSDDRVPGTVTDAEIQGFCGRAEIPENSRPAFAANFRAAVAATHRRGPGYRSPDGADPIISDAKAIYAAAANLLAAIEECGPESRSFIQELLLEGTIDDIKEAVRDLSNASDHLVGTLNNANGRPRNTKGRPSTAIGDPGLPAGDLFAYEAFLYVKQAGGRLTINETNDDRGGSAFAFFKACEPLLPKGVIVPASPFRLRALRAQALGKQRGD